MLYRQLPRWRRANDWLHIGYDCCRRNLMLTGDWTVTGLTDAIGGIILGGVIRLGNQATSI
jgi:hypothetical protein